MILVDTGKDWNQSFFFYFAQQGGGESEFLLDAEPLEELRKDDG